MPHHESVLTKFFSVLSISLAVPAPIVQRLQGRNQGGGGGGYLGAAESMWHVPKNRILTENRFTRNTSNTTK